MFEYGECRSWSSVCWSAHLSQNLAFFFFIFVLCLNSPFPYFFHISIFLQGNCKELSWDGLLSRVGSPSLARLGFAVSANKQLQHARQMGWDFWHRILSISWLMAPEQPYPYCNTPQSRASATYLHPPPLWCWWQLGHTVDVCVWDWVTYRCMGLQVHTRIWEEGSHVPTAFHIALVVHLPRWHYCLSGRCLTEQWELLRVPAKDIVCPYFFRKTMHYNHCMQWSPFILYNKYCVI